MWLNNREQDSLGNYYNNHFVPIIDTCIKDPEVIHLNPPK